MTSRTAVCFLGMLGVAVGHNGCSRAALHAITDEATTDGSNGDGARPVTCPSPTLSPGDTRETVKV
ncbi:MAG: hypothetical protein JXP73_15525, partial [Deltaproteobacteria bacterium]|nr:hypothetical protein [Deltaproteobacteria bacterium]